MPTIALINLQQLLHDQFQESSLLLAVICAILGGIATLIAITYYQFGWNHFSPAMLYQHDLRRRLPQTIIVIRHGESEANANKNLWKTIPDNLLGLTATGQEQAKGVGKRVATILKNKGVQRVHLVVSPFERTLQTAQKMRPYFESLIVRTEIESRIREQEVGNLQGDDFALHRQEQQKVGRYWYRFPTGESGADVQDRAKSWWHESVLTVNARVGYEHVDALIVVTHGLTMRFILTQLFGWSPTTFHSVWNANNCDMYVLQKDLNKPGKSPYVLSPELGDMPRSSIDVSVTLKNTGNKKHLLKLENYLSIPPPRSQQAKLIRYLLAKQYPDIISNPKQITEILFMPFMEGGIIRGRSTSGKLVRRRNCSTLSNDTTSAEDDDDDDDTSSNGSGNESDDDDDIGEMDESSIRSHSIYEQKESAKREWSLRYPCPLTTEMLKGLEGK